MAPFDAAFGAGQDTVNALLPQLFNTLNSTGLFTFDVPINEVGFKSVHINLTQSPTVNFTPTGVPAHVSDTVASGVANAPGLKHLDANTKNAIISSTLAAVSNINFDIIAQGINLTLNYSDTSKQSLSITAKLVLTTLVSVNAGSSPTIGFQAESGIISTSKPDLDDILNNAIVPYVRTKFNSEILKPMSIPVFQIDGITLAVPVVQIVNNYLLAFTSLGTNPSDLPTGPVTWPNQGVFITVDTPLISDLANKALSGAASSLPHTGFNEGPFTGDLGITLGQLQNLDVADNGILTGNIGARAAANITFHTPWPLPNFSFGPVASGTLGVQAKATVENKQVVISNLGITQFNLSIDWGGIASWVQAILNPLLGGLQDALLNTIKPLLTAALSPLVIPVYTIPTISIPVPNGKVNIALKNIETGKTVIEDRNLLIAYGTPAIS